MRHTSGATLRWSLSLYNGAAGRPACGRYQQASAWWPKGDAAIVGWMSLAMIWQRCKGW